MYAYKKENQHQIQLVSSGSEATLRHAFRYALVIEEVTDLEYIPSGYCFLSKRLLPQEQILPMKKQGGKGVQSI
ncbi:hypothetical protein [Culicoidibacter larvae]|uniref:Uncharacterized protein n=1 Tax=Culicoidibacter larvae TaxID=2579976 RepID=A0A5R8Q763_9FIRM|nr:hypothetical protein [Culicoidibacter larvae]TLG71272.1 hypothetical protein FEZ08_11015 [Culicoidibacter larvae]